MTEQRGPSDEEIERVAIALFPEAWIRAPLDCRPDDALHIRDELRSKARQAIEIVWCAIKPRIHPPGEVSEDVVERVARAICRLHARNAPDFRRSDSEVEKFIDWDWKSHQAQARAAIAALPTLPELQESHGQPCHYCGERCNALAGNPSLWPVFLPLSEPGKVEPAHMRCVMERLRATPPERETLIAENEWNAAAAKDMHRRAIGAQEALRIAQEAIVKFLDGDYENPRRHRPGQCAHGIGYWQACENCADAHFEAAKNAIDAALAEGQK